MALCDCRCAFDTVPHRHSNADYAFLATLTELVMMEMERDAFVTPFVPGPPTLQPRHSTPTDILRRSHAGLCLQSPVHAA